jgi:cell division protein FtsN
MRFLTYILLGSVLISSSCAGTNKRLRKSKTASDVTSFTNVEEMSSVKKAAPIKEVEEKLVPIDKAVLNPHRYFVIIGSFRNPENAKQYQTQVQKDGFSSEILKNQEGLYRLSVLATDEISIARDDIRRIRNVFPKYFDTWLLIQKK